MSHSLVSLMPRILFVNLSFICDEPDVAPVDEACLSFATALALALSAVHAVAFAAAPAAADSLPAQAPVAASVNVPLVGSKHGTNPSAPRVICSNDILTNLGFTKYFVNMRSIISAEKRALLGADLENHRPDLVGLTETWLDESVEVLHIPGYKWVSRRDRDDSRSG